MYVDCKTKAFEEDGDLKQMNKELEFSLSKLS